MIHGHARNTLKSPTYHSWHGMLSRCLYPRHPSYGRYGLRGITVCDAWRTFENFLADMGERPVGLELTRIDNNKGYYKENCRWATKAQNNREIPVPSNHLTKINGVRFESNRQKWLARITVNNAAINLGRYVDFFDACCARKSGENKLWSDTHASS